LGLIPTPINSSSALAPSDIGPSFNALASCVAKTPSGASAWPIDGELMSGTIAGGVPASSTRLRDVVENSKPITILGGIRGLLRR